MEGAELMSFRVLWFVVAGFVIGFTTSTLWEWLYYRRKRLAMLDAHSAFVRDVSRTQRTVGAGAAPTDGNDANWSSPPYRSPGIFLESEQPPVDAAFTGAAFSAPADLTPPPDAAPTPSPRQSSVRPPLPPVTPSEPPLRKVPTSSAPTPTVVDPSIPSAPPTTSATMPEAKAEPTPAVFMNNATSDEAATDLPLAPTVDEPARLPTADDPDETDEPPAFNLADLTALTQTTVAAPPAIAAAPDEAPPATSTPSTTTYAATQPARSSVDEAGDRRSRQRPDDYPDDLAMIKGIGEAYKRKLYATSIYTWRQVAESDLDSLRRITRAKPNADIQSWQTQARELAEKYGRWDARFAGPLDDLTQIDGIGAITADMLYKAGICTYATLAHTSPDELARIVPAPTVGNENDFEGWLRDAARLDAVKRKNNGLLP